MLKRMSVCVAACALLGSTAGAQDSRVEIAPFIGYTLSEGFTVNPVTIDGGVFDTISPTSGLSYGFTFDVNISENMAVGFLFSEQQSNLEASGTRKEELTDMSVRNYHGTFTYNFGDSDSSMRPFIMGGVGATNWSPSDIQGIAIDSETKISSTWAGGVKLYLSPNVGIKGMARWTPTYVKSDPAGVWCSPYWGFGCYQLVDTEYSNQLELSVGVALRF